MKVCPVCEAKAFDDAEVCYGCLHRFSDSEGEDRVTDEVVSGEGLPEDDLPEDEEEVVIPFGIPAARNESVASVSSRPVFSSEGLPTFCIKLMPDMRQSEGVAWRCAVELAQA